MFSLFQDYYQDNRIRHLEERISSAKTSSAMGAMAAAAEVTIGLTKRINKLQLMNMALVEILVDKIGVTDEEIKLKISEIDLRDGKIDGEIDEKELGEAAKDCPDCDAKICRDFNRCLFCGYEVMRL